MEDPVRQKIIKKPLFQREISDPKVDSVLRSCRTSACEHHDAGGVERKRKSRSKSKKSRSKTILHTAHFMSPLSFENIDLINTPLSSLRSCSEYNRVNSGQGFIPKAVENEVRKSFWSTLLFWSSAAEKKSNSLPKKKPTQQKVRFQSRDSEEQSFLVERLQFNEANLLEGENYNYRDGDHQISTSPASYFTALTTTTSFGFRNSRTPQVTNSSGQHLHSFFDDTSTTLDYLFGIRLSKTNHDPMEIELKTLKTEYFDVVDQRAANSIATDGTQQSFESLGYDRNRTINSSAVAMSPRHSFASLEAGMVSSTESIAVDMSRPSIPLDNYDLHTLDAHSPRSSTPRAASPLMVSYFRSSERLTQLADINEHQQQRLTTLEAAAHPSSTEGVDAFPVVLAIDGGDNNDHESVLVAWQNRWSCLRRWTSDHWILSMSTVRHWATPFVRNGDEALYEVMRIQPFSSGGYLRGMLMAGLSSMVFQMYHIISWPDSPSVSSSNPALPTEYQWCQSVFFGLLLVQFALNFLQLPLRVHIHLMCWEASRSNDVDQAITMTRQMIQSDAWLLNRCLSLMADVLAIVNLLLTELFLYLVPSTSLSSTSSSAAIHGLRQVVISLCATNVLAFVSRIVVATTYALSLHDPHVVSEARRRGLSKFDLDALPTFVFSSRDDATTEECAICLCPFELGEMLVSLSCDTKPHSFHSNCIRTWLTRQNSCPLCQRIV